MTSPINNSISYAAPPPAYTVDAAPAPRYTPKKDFSKAFSDLQGQYGFDGGAPVIPFKDEKKQSQPKKHNFCLVKGLKSLLSCSSATSTEKAKPSPPAALARVPSPALRIIESGPTLSSNATAAWTYPLRSVSSSTESESANVQAKKQRKQASKQAAKMKRDSAVRGMITGLYGFDTGTDKGRTPGA